MERPTTRPPNRQATRHPQRRVQGVLDGREAEAVDGHRALELARLDVLQLAWWGDAVAGDVKAAGVVLRIIEQRSRLLGLYKPETTPVESGTVVDPAYWEE